MIILADDLTGAAEMAGVAWRHELETRLSRGSAGAAAPPGLGAWVVDTATRDLPPEAAARTVAARLAVRPTPRETYKKTDSVLRGRVRAEIEAALAALGAARCILVPCNPSLGRTIRDGVYHIHGVPLAATGFRRDPTNPATTSFVPDLLEVGKLPVRLCSPGETLPDRGIVVGNATGLPDMDSWARAVDARTLAAGGADFLAALLRARGRAAVRAPAPWPTLGRKILVSGSASEQSRAFVRKLEECGVSVVRVPPALAPRVALRLATSPRAVIAATEAEGHSPVDVLDLLRDAAMRVLAELPPDALLVEGGSTAAALADGLGWTELYVVAEHAPGVIALRPLAAPGTLLVLKPGSYPWPAGVSEDLQRSR